MNIKTHKNVLSNGITCVYFLWLIIITMGVFLKNMKYTKIGTRQQISMIHVIRKDFRILTHLNNN